MTEKKVYRVLALDGGGGKGLYSLGVLREIEKALGSPLQNHFDLFYGTSTGSIIAAALATGESVDRIISFYEQHLPNIMKTFWRSCRSKKLGESLREYFGEKTFEDVPVALGLVGTNKDENKAIIFKSFAAQAHGMKESFLPGFGLTLAEAVEASCSAYPFFQAKKLEPKNMPAVTVVDGGFVANNPALYALIDVRKSLAIPDDKIRILSVGTGNYPESYPFYAWPQGIRLKPTLKLISMQFAANSNSVETIFKLMASGIKTVRVSDSFSEPELATSLFEHRKHVLHRLLAKGRASYASKEKEIKDLLN